MYAVFGPESVFTLESKADLVSVLAMKKRCVVTERILRHYLHTMAEKFGANRPYWLRISTDLANPRRFQRKTNEPFAIFQEISEMQHVLLGNAHPASPQQ